MFVNSVQLEMILQYLTVNYIKGMTYHNCFATEFYQTELLHLIKEKSNCYGLLLATRGTCIAKHSAKDEYILK